MSCACQKISGMKKKSKKISGYQDDIMDAVLDGGLVIGSAYATQKLKEMIPVPTDATTFYGKNFAHIINGIGLVAGLGAGMVSKDPEVKRYLKPIGMGVAAQCGLSLVKSIASGVPSINNWNTYALGSRARVGVQNSYALAAKTRNFNVPGVNRAFDVNGDPAMPKTPANRQPIVRVAKRAVGGL